MIWAPPLFHQGCQEHPVMRPVSLPLTSAPPTPQTQTVQLTRSLSRQALDPPMGGGSKQMDPSWGEQLPDLQASLEEVI